MQKVRVIHIVSSLSSGCGVAQVVITLARHIDRSQFDFSVVGLGGEGDRAEELRALGIPVIAFQGVSSVSPRAAISNTRGLRQLIQYLRREKPDIVHTHEFFSGTLGRTAAILARVPAIYWSLHNPDKWKGWIEKAVDWSLTQFTDTVVVNSAAVADFATGQGWIPNAKVQVVYNGIDLAPFRDLPNRSVARAALGLAADVPVIGTVGRLTRQKGHLYLIEAAARLLLRWPRLRVVIVGGPGHPSESCREQVIAAVEKAGLQDCVLFTGVRDDVPDILPALDIFVFPSEFEGFGLAAVEAMAAGLPVVASAVDGLKEVVAHQHTGILVAPKDSAALAQATAQILENPQLGAQMGAAGRTRTRERFSAAGMTQRLESLYLSSVRRNHEWGT